ncbi:uncharacterized protein LY89DRAFT_612848 [Mollisia scopiformis]|uniref:Laccase n=1 Tax=Mollisia scopiformis TaxID=149040 RepID=A0A194XHJ9_MOLSC|nr:uncharacterized protein LY89DRAFT_612848 [Mollisia scopiformis]KUJ19252.1 hypothetical protein LY89DRAFT_612848 [Mollisia scopiformis]
MMRFTSLVALTWASLVAGQNNYPNLPVNFLQTSNPVTPLPNGYPWGTCTVQNTNPYTNPPNTGVIRSYDFTITRETKSPDGFERSFLLVNDQFPGPEIEANWGDTIQVTVHNQITGPEEGTAIHWHGLLQKGTQYMDGVPGISQCPIPPNGTFTYTFNADLYGTSWYHSHYSAQYAGGIFGPMIIHGPAIAPYDIDIGPVMLTDYFHKDYFSLVEDVVSTNFNEVLQPSDNNLINGQTNATFQFTPGKTHRLRLINSGAEGMQKFSIDGHNLTVIAQDFVPVQSFSTQVVTLGVGQRTDVLVTAPANADGKSYTMRSTLAGNGCAVTNQPFATATVFYNTKLQPNTTAWPSFLTSVASQCANDPIDITQPLYSLTPSAPTTTKDIAINFTQNATDFWLWTMNDISFRADYNSPVFLLAATGNDSYPDPQWNVYNFGSNTSIRVVIENPGPAAHPMHLHGHDFYVLNVGTGTWDGTTIVNAANPQRRDTQIVPAGGFLVIQFEADNPGAWPLHCHIAWHVSAGLYVTVLERPADIANVQVPSIMAQTCRDWSTFTGEDVVDQIDSGL